MAVDDVVYPPTASGPARSSSSAGQKITKNAAETICTSGVKRSR
jgi:hypothetical protein